MSEGERVATAGETPMILYGMSSPNVLKVGIMLEECGFAHRRQFVGVLTGEQFDPAFLAMNPLGKVPVLEDPATGQVVFESGAILIWLAEREGRFLASDPAARCEAIQWLMVQMANVGPILGQLNHFRHSLAGTGGDYATGRYQAAAGRIYRLLDDRLQGREWFAADGYSIADMAMWPWARYLEGHGYAAADFPDLVRWRDAVGDRPAVKRAEAAWTRDFVDATKADARAASDAELDRFFGRDDAMPAADFSSVRRR